MARTFKRAFHQPGNRQAHIDAPLAHVAGDLTDPAPRRARMREGDVVGCALWLTDLADPKMQRWPLAAAWAAYQVWLER